MNTLKRTIHITQTDMGRLRSLLDTMRNSREDLKTLRAELDSAQVTGPYEMPADVITMNSKVQLRDLATDEVMEYTIVFPTKANADEGLISVLAPIGTAALGQRVGDVIECVLPSGILKLEVEEILYQPEAAGHYHL